MAQRGGGLRGSGVSRLPRRPAELFETETAYSRSPTAPRALITELEWRHSVLVKARPPSRTISAFSCDIARRAVGGLTSARSPAASGGFVSVRSALTSDSLYLLPRLVDPLCARALSEATRILLFGHGPDPTLLPGVSLAVSQALLGQFATANGLAVVSRAAVGDPSRDEAPGARRPSRRGVLLSSTPSATPSMRRSRRCFECCFARRVSHKPPNGPLKRASSGAEPAYRCCAAALLESSSPPVDLPRFGRHGLLGRWLFDFAGSDCLLGLLVLSRGEHAEGGVAALAVVERLDVLEHGGLELEPRRPCAAVDELFLERREERLGDGVVVGVPAGAH